MEKLFESREEEVHSSCSIAEETVSGITIGRIPKSHNKPGQMLEDDLEEFLKDDVKVLKMTRSKPSLDMTMNRS